MAIGASPVGARPIAALNNVSGAVTPKQVSIFSGNSFAPQIVDFARAAGYAVFFAMAAAAPVPTRASTFVQQFAAVQQQAVVSDQVSTRAVWPSRVAGAKPRKPTYIQAAPQQVDLTQQAQFYKPLITGQGKLGSYLTAAPQQADLTRQAQFYKPLITGQRKLGSYLNVAPQQADLTQQAGIYKPLSAGPGKLGNYLITLPQTYVDPPASVWPSERTPPVVVSTLGSYLNAAPQQADLTQQAVFFPSVRNPQGASGSSKGTFGSHAAALYDAERAKTQIWPSQRTPVVAASTLGAFVQTADQPQDRPAVLIWPSERSGQTTPIIPYLQAAPQQVDLTRQAQFYKPLITGQRKLGSYLNVAPQQADLTQQAGIYKPLVAGGGKLGNYVEAAPQQADLTQQAQFYKPLITGQGVLGTYFKATPQTYADPAPALWPSQRTPVISVSTLGAFVQTADQPQSIPTTAVWPSQRTPAAAPTGTRIKFFLVYPVDLSQNQPQIFRAAFNLQGVAGSSKGTFGLHAAALYDAERAKTQIWPSAQAAPGWLQCFIGAGPDYSEFYILKSQVWHSRQIGGLITGRTIRQIGAAPDFSVLYNLQPQIWPSRQIAGLIIGPSVFRHFFASPQQVDLTLQARYYAPYLDLCPQWTNVNDGQTPGWGVVVDSQTPAWVAVTDSQTPGWAAVTDSQTPAWTPVDDTETPGWVVIPKPNC